MAIFKKYDEPKRVLVLNGHPDKNSLNGSLAVAAADASRQLGRETQLIHLGDMIFSPDLSKGYNARIELEPDLLAFQEALVWCDTFVLVHPLWWGSCPAKLKGLFDRAFLPGFAFRYAKGKPLPEKLLAGRTARVLITSDTPDWYLRTVYRNAWPNVLRRQILDFVGLMVTHLVTIGPMKGAKPNGNQKWSEAARKLVT